MENIKKGNNRFYIGGAEETAMAEISFIPKPPDTIIIDHTNVSVTMKGQGIGVQLVNKVAEYARQENLKIIPRCPFANKIMTGNPEYSDVLLEKKQARIKIVKDGPYLVSGNVPLSEKIIVPKGNTYEYKEGRELPQSENYALCRCGKSKNAPFCDGSHNEFDFDGTETASRDSYADRAKLKMGPDLDLLDDHRCCFGRFCHQEDGKAWDLVKYSDRGKYKKQAIQAANECPAGRLTAVEKNGKLIEPEYEPSIIIAQDPQQKVSAGIFVRGGIPIESADGETYEVRNRVALCRCGESRNKPFCDATHVPVKFTDGE